MPGVNAINRIHRQTKVYRSQREEKLESKMTLNDAKDSFSI